MAMAGMAVENRNALKVVFRAGLFPNAGSKTLDGMLLEKAGDATEVIRSAGKTNRGFNALGASSLGSTLRSSDGCECD